MTEPGLKLGSLSPGPMLITVMQYRPYGMVLPFPDNLKYHNYNMLKFVCICVCVYE